MKIYVLISNDDDNVIGVYSSEEKAMSNLGKLAWTYRVEEHWLDDKEESN